MTRIISVTDTAKLIRAALKEAFPGVKFSVKSSKYSMGASIRVSWVDGPNSSQVEAVTGRFNGSYFDGTIDYKGNVTSLMDGEAVSFGADSVHLSRNFSDAWIQRAIDRVYARYQANFERDGIEKPTVEDYNYGRTYNLCLSGLHIYGGQNVQAEISAVLSKHSDRLKIEKSPTAAKIFVAGDDGYSRSCGGGMSVVDADLQGEASLAETVAHDVTANFIERLKTTSK